MNLRRSAHRATQLGLFIALAGVTWAASNCDLNLDGVVNVVDVQLMTNMVLGASTCGANIFADGACNNSAITLVIDAALGGPCHTVTLSWTAAASAAGYNLYRSQTSGGPYTRVNSAMITGTKYYDISVQPGQGYYYVATSVDASNNESPQSGQVAVTIPTP